MTEKRPAHEVILSKLRGKMQQLMGVRVEDSFNPSGVLKLGEISVLLDVLAEMAITEKEREKVLTDLAQLAAMWKLGIPWPNMVEFIHHRLSQP